MINNNDSSLLLEWAAHELSFRGHQRPIYDFQQLGSTPFLYDLLLTVDQDYFCPLNHLVFEFAPYLQSLETYLLEIQGKRLARSYRKGVVEEESMQEIIKMVLFLLLQGKQKGEFISRIVEMSVEVQSYLMREIKKIQGHLQNYVEIKDILNTVEKLEEENDSLRQRLKAVTEQGQQLADLMAETSQEKRRVEKELNRYETQKKQIFQELQIDEMRDYALIYRGVKAQNEELSVSIARMQENKRETQLQNRQMKQQISEDCMIIQQLNQEITTLKTNYHSIKEDMNTLSLSYEHPLEDTILRENKNIGNVKVRLSLQTSCSDKSLFLNSLNLEDDENDRLRNYNYEIMHKLQNCYKTISDLTQEVNSLKDEKTRQERRNCGLQKKLGDLKKEQSRFVRELKKMGF